MTLELFCTCVVLYIVILPFSMAIFHGDYIDDRLTLFETFTLSLLWPISLPFKLIKTFVRAIKKI